jgi:Protein of unknown function (DUF3800)
VRVLLDECLPKRLKPELVGHNVRTAPEMGWAGKRNGELLALAVGQFEIFLTADRNVSYQQDLSSFDIAVVVLVARSNRFEDPIHSSYAKADEAAEVILSNIMEQAPTLKGTGTIDSLLTVDSKETPGVQLADLLVGAVLAVRHGHITAEPKRALVQRIAEHLGWMDLTSDTMPRAQKFNIWRFWDPTSGKPRPEVTRLTTKTS